MPNTSLFNTYGLDVTKEGRKLAKKYFEFVTNVLRRRVTWNRATSLIDTWARDFDGYARETKTPYPRLNQVLDWYMDNHHRYRYTYPCPISFLDHFRSVEQNWQWSFRPIPAEELTAITDKLLVEKWPGNTEDLITVVSKSVYAVRNVLKHVDCLPEMAMRGVDRSITSVNMFVLEHMNKWRKRNINRNDTPLWTAEISENLVLDVLVAEWKKMGYSSNECTKMREMLLNGCRKVAA